MICYIYKSARRAETYLYIRDQDEFAPVPETLLEALGTLTMVMQLDLAATGRLAQANPDEVIRQIASNGYYLQMPPKL